MKKKLFKNISIFMAVVLGGLALVVCSPFLSVNAYADSYIDNQKDYIESRFNFLSSYVLVDSDMVDFYGDGEGELAYRVCSFTYLADGDMWAFATIQNSDESELTLDTYFRFMFSDVTTQLGSNPYSLAYNYDWIFPHQLDFTFYDDSYEYNWIFYYNYSSNLNRLFMYVLGMYDDYMPFSGEYYRYLGNVGATINELSQEEYQAIFDAGLQQGREENISESMTSPSYIFNTLADGVDDILSLHLAPNITIGLLIFVPLFFVVLGAIINYWRKH